MDQITQRNFYHWRISEMPKGFTTGILLGALAEQRDGQLPTPSAFVESMADMVLARAQWHVCQMKHADEPSASAFLAVFNSLAEARARVNAW